MEVRRPYMLIGTGLYIFSFYYLLYRVTTDHNEDSTVDMLQSWADAVRPLYHRVNLTIGVDGRMYITFYSVL